MQADASVGKVAEGGIAVAVSEVLGKGASVANEHIVVEGDFEKGSESVNLEEPTWDEGVDIGASVVTNASLFISCATVDMS